MHSTLQSMLSILDIIVSLREYCLQILERIDEASLGIRGKIIGKDMDCPPVVPLATAD